MCYASVEWGVSPCSNLGSYLSDWRQSSTRFGIFQQNSRTLEYRTKSSFVEVSLYAQAVWSSPVFNHCWHLLWVALIRVQFEKSWSDCIKAGMATAKPFGHFLILPLSRSHSLSSSLSSKSFPSCLYYTLPTIPPAHEYLHRSAMLHVGTHPHATWAASQLYYGTHLI